MMAKRFTDTEKWNEDWFLDLPTNHKLFWIYICDNCNHAGIFKPNKRMFELLIGEKINSDNFIKDLNSDKDRIIVLPNGRWYLTGFIKFQYGETLNPNNRVHNSILNLLQQNDITFNNTVQLELGKTSKPTQKPTPESLEEAQDYFVSKGSNKKEAEKFYNFYGSKGWKVGKSPMKNWKMSASNWISRNAKHIPDSNYLGSQLKQMGK